MVDSKNMPDSSLAYCLLGSNVGPRAALLRRAVLLLGETPHVEVLRASSLYETPPWGKIDQPPFLNAAVELRTTLPPEDLLARSLEVERRLGRDRAVEQHWGPRPIDIDLALHGNAVLDTSALALPHPRLPERAFALVPLLELAPDLHDPRTGAPYAEALERLGLEAREACRPVESLLLDAAEFAKRAKPAVQPGLYLSHSARETQALAQALAAQLRGGEVVALVGNLGAGKTCFAGGFAAGLGIREPVTSPSYVLVKSYEGGRLTLHHADFYRLSDAVAPPAGTPLPGESFDLGSVGLEDYLDDPASVVLVEWADRFPEWLEPPFTLIEITRTGPSNRLLLVRFMTR
jgi:2-amino-4-hydroxy-6-hydroxymethyldihydropteridine diphosphokinase